MSTNNSSRDFKNALKTISSRLNIYVNSTTGSDTNTGLSASTAFSTITKAFTFLDDKYITDEGFVNIVLSAGTHIIDEEIVISHAQGDRIAIIGATPQTYTVKEAEIDDVTAEITPNSFGVPDTLFVVTCGTLGASGFTAEHAVADPENTAFVIKNSTLNSDISVRAMFADQYPNNSKQVALLGSFLHADGISSSSYLLLQAPANNRRFLHPRENYPPGNIYRNDSVGGPSVSIDDAASGEQIVLACDPTGDYGDYASVGITATTAITFTDQESYLYNNSVPTGTQVTDHTLTVIALTTIVKASSALNSLFRIENSALHSIKNVFFDGRDRDEWVLNFSTDNHALLFSQSTLGKQVTNQPADAPTMGLVNVGFAKFDVGVHATNNSSVDLGSAVASACNIGFLAEKNSVAKGEGLAATYCSYAGFSCIDNSIMEIPNSICGIGGFSTSVTMFSPYGTTTTSFSPGDTIVQDNASGWRTVGKVMSWDKNSGLLVASHAQGLCENSKTFEIGFGITGATGGMTGSMAQGSIISVSDTCTGFGFFAANGSHINAPNSISAFNRHSNFTATSGSTIKCYGSASIASWHSGFLASQNSIVDATASISMLSKFGYRAENNSQISANASVSLNNYKHNYLAKNNSGIGAIGYESRIGDSGQIEGHFMSTNGSHIANVNPVLVETDKYIAGTTFSPLLVMPSTDFNKNYAALTY